MTATETRDFAQELAAVDRELKERNAARDRYTAVGDDAAATRVSTAIAALEQRRRNIESARRGQQQIALEEARAINAKQRAAAATHANRYLDDLLKQARELEGIEGRLLRQLSDIHHTEAALAGALSRFADDRVKRDLLHRLEVMVGRQQIEDFLERTNLVGLGERVAKDVATARGFVDRIVAHQTTEGE